MCLCLSIRIPPSSSPSLFPLPTSLSPLLLLSSWLAHSSEPSHMCFCPANGGPLCLSIRIPPSSPSSLPGLLTLPSPHMCAFCPLPTVGPPQLAMDTEALVKKLNDASSGKDITPDDFAHFVKQVSSAWWQVLSGVLAMCSERQCAAPLCVCACPALVAASGMGSPCALQLCALCAVAGRTLLSSGRAAAAHPALLHSHTALSLRARARCCCCCCCCCPAALLLLGSHTALSLHARAPLRGPA